MLLGAEGSGVMLLTLVGAAGLTYWDCRSNELSWRSTAWWVSLVLLLHVVGYGALRLWLATRSDGTEQARVEERT